MPAADEVAPAEASDEPVGAQPSGAAEDDEAAGVLAQPLDTHPDDSAGTNGQLAQLAAQLAPAPPEPEPAEEDQSHLATHTPTQPMRPTQPEVLVPRPDTWRDAEQLALPLPPAPPGERGYRPGDVERFMQLLADMLDSPDAPDPDALGGLKLSRTFFVGQGYHVGVVDAMKTAWLEELHRRAL